MTNLLKHAAHNKQVDNALRIAIEAAWDKLDDKPVQKPVACRFCHSEKGCWAWQCYKCGEIDDVQQPAAQPEQEPVAWMSSDRAWMWSDYSKAIAAVANIPTLTLIPLYAAPPQRPWVGLTPEEVQFYALKHRQLVNAHYDAASDTNIIAAAFEATVFYETVEQALKDKNHG